MLGRLRHGAPETVVGAEEARREASTAPVTRPAALTGEKIAPKIGVRSCQSGHAVDRALQRAADELPRQVDDVLERDRPQFTARLPDDPPPSSWKRIFSSPLKSRVAAWAELDERRLTPGRGPARRSGESGAAVHGSPATFARFPVRRPSRRVAELLAKPRRAGDRAA
jgi:hypothetical protein